MPSTAPPMGSAPFSNYTTLFTNVIVPFMEEAEVADQVYDSVPLFQLLVDGGRVERRELGSDWLHRVNLTEAPDAQPFTGYQSYSVEDFSGATAVRFQPANYVQTMRISWEEVMQSTTPDAMVDTIEQKMEKLILGFRNTLALDLYRGNSGNSQRILGMEQLAFAAQHGTSAGAVSAGVAITAKISKRSQIRQADNTYGTITRVPWTITSETGGTNWENLSINLGTNSNTTGFALSSGNKNDTLKRWEEALDWAAYGGAASHKPDTVPCGPTPYRDMEDLIFSKNAIERAPSAYEGVELGVPHFTYRGAVYIRDNDCVTYNTLGDATAGTDRLYAFRLADMKLVVDARAEFAPQPYKTSIGQVAYLQEILWRGQFYNINPRRVLTGFNYPA